MTLDACAVFPRQQSSAARCPSPSARAPDCSVYRISTRAEAGPGLLIPRCSSVHTFGMRFALDLVFLDAAAGRCSFRRAVPPRRFAWDRRASAVP